MVLSGLGGAINAVAGGGSFLVFPALVLTGMSPIHANATTTMALWPGSVSGAYAYRRQLGTGNDLKSLIILSLLGSAVGAAILLLTPEETFRDLIPWLLLAATLIFAFGKRTIEWLRLSGEATPLRKACARSLQLGIGLYGGYFGAGIGILMLAMLQLLGFHEIHRMNAIKTILGSAINGLAVVIFIFAGVIVWDKAGIMLIGGILGGWLGAHGAQKLPAAWVRGFVVFVGTVMTIFFFCK